MEIQSSPAAIKTTRSRKTSSATILTDGTDNEPAFESDAFAVLMPTTREPIEHVERPRCEFRAKLPFSPPAQVAAYQHCAEKTRRNASQGYKREQIFNRLVSYDYGYSDLQPAPRVVYDQVMTPPMSPPTDSSGTFPATPPLLPPLPPHNLHPPRSIATPPHALTRKSVAVEPSLRHSAEVQNATPRYASSGAQVSPPLSPTKSKDKVKVRMKPRTKQESWWSRSTAATPSADRPYASSSSGSTLMASRTPSPTKSRPAAGSRTVPYIFKEAPGAWHTAPDTTAVSADAPAQPKLDPSRTRGLGFSLSWLKPAGPRDPSPSQYSSPFTTTLTPNVAHKLTHAIPPRPNNPAVRAQIFENGFAQVQRAVLLLMKLCLLVYLAVGVWHVLDAVREAWCVVTWPVRAIGLVWGFVWGTVWEMGGIGVEI
jgi:hypothetical protein